MEKPTQQPIADAASPELPNGHNGLDRPDRSDGIAHHRAVKQLQSERTTPNLHLEDRQRLSPSGASAVGLAVTLNGPATPQPAQSIPEPPNDLVIAAHLGAIPGPLQQWERYQIQKLLGQGGMGTVFLARDRRLGRSVAIKWLRVPSAEAAERLQQEARAQARLDHSGICKVFEVGEFHGQPYIAMEYINGQPLNLAVRGKCLEQKVMLMRQIALAVHAAHCQGILHRDIKPANILVCTTEAESSDDGGIGLRPVLMDFGLARDALGPQRLTQTGVIMGTPHYMAPEQARGQARHLDRRADVYSLGAVLHELLAGKPPFDAENEVELLLSVLNQDPPSLRQIEASVPPDLEVIVLKCLQKEPAQRYESALALAEDLGRYLRGEPIVARPASTLYRLRRLAQRHRAWVAVAALLLISLSCFGLMTARARQERHVAAERAKEREQLAAQLGKTVTEMKLFLRVAYSLPPHDLRREQKLIRTRLEQLEQQLQRSDASLKGALEGVIGQGYLVLGDNASAVQYLERALAHGYEKRGVHLSLGQALGRRFEQQRDTLRRSAAEDQFKPQVEALRRQYVVRARQELQQGSDAEPGSADYIDALLHYYESDSPEALAKALAGARKVQEETPWFLEPFDLEVKIRIEQISAQLARGQLDDRQQVAEVQATLSRAIELARSYPNFYMSSVQFSLIMLKLALFSGGHPKDVESIYLAGIERGKVAVTLLPESGEAHDQLARLYSYWSYFNTLHNKDSGDALEQGLKVLALADKLPPERAEHYFVRGRLRDALSLRKWHDGASTLPELAEAIGDIRKASSLDPGNADYLNTLAVLLDSQAKWRQEHGGDSLALWKECIAAGERASALQPQQAILRANLASFRMELALDYLAHGIDPTAEISRARAELQAALAINPNVPTTRDAQLFLTSVELRQQLEAGQVITAQAAELIERHRKMTEQSPTVRTAWEARLQAGLLYGEALLRKGESPEPAITSGLADLQAAVRALPLPGVQADFGGKFLLLRARWLLRAGKSPLPVLTMFAALPKVTLGPQSEGKLASIELTRAQLLRLAASWQSSHGPKATAATAAATTAATPASATIDQGLAALDEADRLAGGLVARAQAERGALLALKAQALTDPSAKKQAAREATALLQAALHDSPPLTADYRSYLEAAAPL